MKQLLESAIFYNKNEINKLKKKNEENSEFSGGQGQRGRECLNSQEESLCRKMESRTAKGQWEGDQATVLKGFQFLLPFFSIWKWGTKRGKKKGMR